MNRLYEPAAYGPQGACYWADTVDPLHWPTVKGDKTVDVAVIGGGFTGLSAALHLAQRATSVAVIEAEHPGYGASGRNGGFACLGGAKASRSTIKRRFGEEGLRDWHQTEIAAVNTVSDLITRHSMQVDRHSDGETLVAHSARQWNAMRAEVATLHADYGMEPTLIPPDQLRQSGLGGRWHGASTMPIGFALNPRKFHSGLANAAQTAGAHLFANSPVTSLHRNGSWHLTTPQGTIRANSVILATNGYSSEDLPPWLASRTLPVQSSVIVTRPLTQSELDAQGWRSHQMTHDTRQLLHYFRLMPNGRFLFGMRGGRRATTRATDRIDRKIRANFARLFPAWRAVEITHQWSGLICLMAQLAPFAGPVPGHPGLFAGLGYHGNGVAMGTHTGRLLAGLALDEAPTIPALMQATPRRFPLGRFRRALLAPAYFGAELFDL